MNVILNSVGTYADEEGLHPMMSNDTYDSSELMTIRYEDASDEFVSAMSEEDLFNFNLMERQHNSFSILSEIDTLQ